MLAKKAPSIVIPESFAADRSSLTGDSKSLKNPFAGKSDNAHKSDWAPVSVTAETVAQYLRTFVSCVEESSIVIVMGTFWWSRSFALIHMPFAKIWWSRMVENCLFSAGVLNSEHHRHIFRNQIEERKLPSNQQSFFLCRTLVQQVIWTMTTFSSLCSSSRIHLTQIETSH